jgi:hypothetical protein
MESVAYVGLRRNTDGLKMHVRFRFRFVHIWSGARRPKPWPKIEDASDAVPLNENALVLW